MDQHRRLTPAERAAIVSAARAWIGTPYHHQASLRGTGCDCVGLVRGLWRELIGPEPEPIAPYARDLAETTGVDRLTALARRHLIARPLDEAELGDILAFRLPPVRIAKHVAVLAGPDSMIHACEGLAVCEAPLTASWRRRLVGVLSFPPLG